MNNSYLIVRETWLTRKPAPLSALFAAVTTFALAIGSVVYLSNFGGLAEQMSATQFQIFSNGEWWRAWTTLFAHADFGHFASNSFLFFILGFFLYGYFGWRFFPVSAIAWGGLTNLIVLKTYPPETVLIGASGVVYWMGGAWLVLYFFLSRQKNLSQRWLRSLGVGILIFMPAETFEPRISYRTHFIGFGLGMIAGLCHYLLHRKKFMAAEVAEMIHEENDPEEDLPPPEGWSTKI